MTSNKLELLAPAGDLEKLIIAVEYGADAVYFGGESFSLRAGADGFSKEDMAKGIAYAHDRDKKCYLTLNIFAHNRDLGPIRNYLDDIKGVAKDLDGILVSDPGILNIVKDKLPMVPLHLSTQANMTNYESAKFWQDQGVKRLVVARELSLNEIREIKDNIPEDMELEAFVHGAMCMSYSGRCLLSNVMTGRDANQGMCAHPCRYSYALMEEKRPGEYYPVEEDVRGTYIMNSKDLSMLEHIPDLIEAGIISAKIEGRNKTAYYVATVVGAYRRAIDQYYNDPENYTTPTKALEALGKASHRQFSTGFYYGNPTEEGQNYESSAYIKDYTYLGIVKEYMPDKKLALCEQRNKFTVGEEVEIFGPDGREFTQSISKIYDFETGEELETAPHPKQQVLINVEEPVEEFYMIRRKEK